MYEYIKVIKSASDKPGKFTVIKRKNNFPVWHGYSLKKICLNNATYSKKVPKEQTLAFKIFTFIISSALALTPDCNFQ